MISTLGSLSVYYTTTFGRIEWLLDWNKAQGERVKPVITSVESSSLMCLINKFVWLLHVLEQNFTDAEEYFVH